MQPFNPFTSRQKNTNVKWFEADLEKFYTFVENQPLLSAAQEQLYGKALKMWFQVELKKEKLIEMSLNQTITSEMLARYIGCSEQTLEKMEK
jgi:hypothetical protein